ncbi:para-nitrobenzyl esterase (carboxylesterase) [Colletotrichum truncatum]|uniref:Para-nitrobenzyl esterase (Carboxylesterase) n=1 Tax=Colletotrichum truncatum TaxID=5467 RepID=A0ACC3YWM4_COLTU|nr:para-nitrobenzyl esterase (carboxylesterase) [Colletotrichum truncatum]KAF6787517.1 para-nitrobenzyl esterase (carboxylesterase) [Colletotrichum truncatum]
MSTTRYSSVVQLLLSATLFLQASALPAANAVPTVTIDSGVIVGTTAQPVNQAGPTGYANAYLGVPFAKSPPERFSPPQAAPAWSLPLTAQAFKPACIQQFTNRGDAQVRQKQYFGNPTGALTEESEDCLYLNVFSPPSASSTNTKAVMFWIFPGNLQFGTASLPIYDGSSLAVSQDVVVVTINYRTNIFGFSNSPEIPTGSQNSGYLDQRFALKWVQDNIAKFGGDPSRVTIFGESAGGESVKQLLANPPSPLPFSAAIMQSQQSMLIGSGSESYQKVLKNFKCDTASSPIACLREISATDLKAYIESEALVFPPVNGDGTSVSDVRSSISSKKWPNIPVLLGTNLNEGRVFLAVEGVKDPMASAMSLVGINSSTTKKSVLDKYTAFTDPNVISDRIITDAIFTCTTSTLSNYLARYGYTAYRYRYDASFASTDIFKNAGAYHTSEIPSVFGTYPLYSKFGSVTDQQIKLSSYMQKLWSGFAKKPSDGMAWPKVSVLGIGLELGVLGSAASTAGVSKILPALADYPCAAYWALEDMMGFSY